MPSAPSRVGGLSRVRSDCRTGSCGASSGAATAITKSATTNASAPSASHGSRRDGSAPSTGTETGIEDAIEDIDEEIHDDEDHGRQEDRALHDRIVAVVDRVDGESADAGPGEDGLRDHGAGEELTELQARDGDDRERGIAQRVLHHDEQLGHSLGARSADE